MRLFNIVTFTAVAPAASQVRPHGLNWGSRTVIPDVLTPGTGGNSFSFTADATNVTATNLGTMSASVDVLAASWHTILRCFGGGAVALTPQPFVANSAQGVLDVTSPQGNTVIVDPIFGSDTTGARQGPPFATVAPALAAAQSGDAVIIRPGTYDLPAGITVPTGVTVIGTANATTLRMLNVTSATTLVTMSNNCRLEQLDLVLTSVQHVDLIGVDFPGTTTDDAEIHDTHLVVSNSTAGAVGTSTVIGIRSNGTGASGHHDNLHEATIHVNSAGLGTKRGVLIAGASSLRATTASIYITNAGGAGSYIGVETNHAGAIFTGSVLSITGPTADISQTLGALRIDGSVNLATVNANGLGFGVLFHPTVLQFGDPGTLPNGTRYFYPGTANVATTPVRVRIPAAAVIKSISIHASVAPGPGSSTVVTIQKNAVDTIVTATLSNAATDAFNDAVSVGFAAGDDISVKVVNNGATQDVMIVIELF